MSGMGKRISSIDILRGIVMILMALDHVRDYFHLNALAGNDPTNLDTTTPFLFFTRFITHFCAPVFVFLAGTSAFLFGRNKTKKDLSYFLITRGIWLILVEIFINNFLWWFDLSFGFINLQVIWVIGLCMIVLGIAVYLPTSFLIAIGLLLVFGHHILDSITMQGKSFSSVIWYALHQVNGFQIGENRYLWFSYPAIPWIGVMFLGYALGQLYTTFSSSDRKKWLLYLGLGCISLFFVLRGLNIYGDPTPWEVQQDTTTTLLSFFKLNKYPPSLSFLLITLGPAFLALRALENSTGRIAQFLTVYGRVPFFYYILHILIIHLAAMLGLFITGKDWKLMILSNESFSQNALNGYGYSLGIVYLVWIGIVLLLYPICKRYMIYKAGNKDKKWLSYL